MKKDIEKDNKRKKGVAVLFAVLVSVFLVSVATTIVSIALRQTILSSTGRDSQQALFAANTVLECAMFWDLNPTIVLGGGEVVFPVPGLPGFEYSPSDTAGIECNGGNIITGANFTTDFAKVGKINDVDTRISTIHIELKPTVSGTETGTYCASARVQKNYDEDTGVTTTIIDAKGYNTCDLNYSRAIERGLQLSYTS